MAYAGVKCFWLEPTGDVQLSLRRYISEEDRGPCPHGDYCQAMIPFSREKMRLKEEPDGWHTLESYDDLKPADDDSRWPLACSRCGRDFKDGATRQLFQAEVYKRSDTGEEVTVRGYGGIELAGALYDGWWLHGRKVVDKQGRTRGYTGEDGIALIAICPNGGAWQVDGPSGNGNGWTRTGDPRKPETLSVTPSIVAGDYHGFLTGGSFTDG